MSNAPFFVDREIIVISSNGVWLSDGVEISHIPTRSLFAKSLKRDQEGYFLQIGRETKHIEVEDTAYFINRIHGNSETGYTLEISDETQEKLIPQTLRYQPGRLSCSIKIQNSLAQSEEAKFLHIAYFDLLKNLEEDDELYFLVIENQRVNLAIKMNRKEKPV